MDEPLFCRQCLMDVRFLVISQKDEDSSLICKYAHTHKTNRLSAVDNWISAELVRVYIDSLRLTANRIERNLKLLTTNL